MKFRQRQILYHLYVESEKNSTSEIIYKTEMASQTYKTNLWLPKGKGVWRDN